MQEGYARHPHQTFDKDHFLLSHDCSVPSTCVLNSFFKVSPFLDQSHLGTFLYPLSFTMLTLADLLLNLKSNFLCRFFLQIGLIMGQIITRLTGGIEKQDINLDYETYGIEGERDYATDRNGEYDYDYDNMEETNESQGTQRTARPKVKIKCTVC